MEMKESIKKALEELRKNEKKKFIQTVDLIINLQKFDIKKETVNIFVPVPHRIKDKKVCAFLESKNPNVDTITKLEFKRYENKKEAKKLAKQYDFFIAETSLMPSVATTFGKVLGPSGKMPSPQVGVLMNTDEKTIKEVINRVDSSIKIKTKEPSIKVPIGKENMKDDEIAENVLAVYNAVLKALVKGKESIRNVKIKFTMTKPQKIDIEGEKAIKAKR
ncbi:MAG: hypothetical protein Q7R52_01955 [archaeon]|nr:hypothetical protein [archaeon]